MNRSLRFEQFEERELLAGRVDVTETGHMHVWAEPSVRNDIQVQSNGNFIETIVNGDLIDRRTASAIESLSIYGGPKDDTLDIRQLTHQMLRPYLSGGDGNDIIYGNGEKNIISGGDGNDVMHGGDGDDSFFDTSGKNHVIGGEGEDVLFQSNVRFVQVQGHTSKTSNGKTVFDESTKRIVVNGTEERDVIFGQYSAVPLSVNGDEGNDFIYGSQFGDRLYGQGGRDILFGNGGDDWIEGDFFIHIPDGATEGRNIIDGGDGDDTIIGSEMNDVIKGGSGDDIAEGNDGNDVILGNDGIDILSGNNGDDTILGNNGDDIINGDSGNDYIIGGAGRDSIEGGIGDDNLIGSTGPDELFGQEGNDYLSGGEGEDDLSGGSGDDILYSWNSRDANAIDVLYGGSGKDVIHADNNDVMVNPELVDEILTEGNI